MFSLITKQISKAPLSTSFLSPRCSTVPIASSGLSDSEGVGKIGPSEETKRERGEDPTLAERDLALKESNSTYREFKFVSVKSIIHSLRISVGGPRCL